MHGKRTRIRSSSSSSSSSSRRRRRRRRRRGDRRSCSRCLDPKRQWTFRMKSHFFRNVHGIHFNLNCFPPSLFAMSYYWWLKSYTTWDVWNPINNGKNNQPQLVSLSDFSHQQLLHVAAMQSPSDREMPKPMLPSLLTAWFGCPIGCRTSCVAPHYPIGSHGTNGIFTMATLRENPAKSYFFSIF